MARISIPVKFMAVGILTLAINGALVGAGLWIANTLGDRLTEGVSTTTALRNHLEADMMHDALRADVLAALNAVRANDAAAKSAVKADLAEHATNFKERMAENQQLSLSDAIRKPLDAVQEPLNAYIESATTFINQVIETGAEQPGALQAFSERFSVLETQMSEVSDAIEAAVKEAQEHGESEAGMAQTLMFGALGFAALFSLLTFLYNAGGIARPLVRISRAMTSLANAEQNVEIPFVARRDEIGDLARAAQSFRDAQVAQKTREAEQRLREEEGARASRREALRGFAETFDRNVSEVIKSVTLATDELGTLALQLGDSARMADDRTASLVDATTRAAVSVDAVSGATGQLSGAVDEIARQVTESQGLSTGAVREVERADQVVEGLAKAAKKIGDVVGLISDVAAQTNLLALNATIEAARAGEAGKGFAVVASEVKSLANQTAKATEDISTQIAAIQTSSGEVSSVIKQVKDLINNINSASTAISAAVEEQGASTREIARQVGDMNSETKAISSNSGEVADSIEKTQNAASAVQNASEELRTLSGQLRVRVDKFLSELQAA